MQVQEAYDTWRQAGERMEQLGLQARHHCRWRSCQKAFEVRCCSPALRPSNVRLFEGDVHQALA